MHFYILHIIMLRSKLIEKKNSVIKIIDFILWSLHLPFSKCHIQYRPIAIYSVLKTLVPIYCASRFPNLKIALCWVSPELQENDAMIASTGWWLNWNSPFLTAEKYPKGRTNYVYFTLLRVFQKIQPLVKHQLKYTKIFVIFVFCVLKIF